jgi:hypothetical protein
MIFDVPFFLVDVGGDCAELGQEDLELGEILGM